MPALPVRSPPRPPDAVRGAIRAAPPSPHRLQHDEALIGGEPRGIGDGSQQRLGKRPHIQHALPRWEPMQPIDGDGFNISNGEHVLKTGQSPASVAYIMSGMGAIWTQSGVPVPLDQWVALAEQKQE